MFAYENHFEIGASFLKRSTNVRNKNGYDSLSVFVRFVVRES